MEERYSRTANLIGKEGLDKLRAAHVLIVGIGGVGSYAAEAIARASVGNITLMDGDEIAESNLNRQLVALTSTLEKNKAQVMAERIKDINPDIDVRAIPRFYEVEDELNLKEFDWIVDAIDSVDAKVELILKAKEQGINIVSSMGAAGKLGTNFIQADIYSTTVCPLAKIIRKRMREEGIESLPVVFSEEKSVQGKGKSGTLSYVPAAAGLELAAYVIREILEREGRI
ncbi:MAG TPA: tRNA threonylcarbamoyladenosine dehydratase [Mogibacterium sp.]|nr:tRNA threonylcarbamoyladenosine dehydratase [Mogibacterium sp.]